MSALRSESFDHHLGSIEPTPSAPRAGMRAAGATTISEDDATARGVVLGIGFSVIGFWLPLAATVGLWLHRR